ncbi:MAG: hypothetical protein ACK58T_33325 [Phycisphaerae bacterium]|jgi:hypothetical protein
MRMKVTALTLVAIATLSGCRAPGSPEGLRAHNVNVGGWPFVPTAMRVYPLTHLEPATTETVGAKETKREARIVVHLEFRDAWGDGSKAVGPLTLFVYGPDGGKPGAASVQQCRYDIDLSDLRRNAELFDPATRTYRVPLAGLPEWLSELSSQPGKDAMANVKVTVRAEMKSPRADGSQAMLVDEYVVTK